MAGLWSVRQTEPQSGLVCLRRRVACEKKPPLLLGADLAGSADEFERRCRTGLTQSAGARQLIRDQVIRDAGGLTYGHINNEFRRVASQLGWPPPATLKDFRHLFSTCLANGGMPEHERRYLMGHAPGRDAIQVYTHMNQIAEHYRSIAKAEWSEVLQLIRARFEQETCAPALGAVRGQWPPGKPR